MTQPIQEPGPTTRTDAKLTWGTNQLFRRPAPPQEEGGCACTIDWQIGWQTARRTQASSAETTIASWDEVEGGGNSISFDADKKPEILETGVYLIEIAGDWSDSVDPLDSVRGYWALGFTNPPDTFFWQTIGGLAGSGGPYRMFDWSSYVGQSGAGQFGSNVQLFVTEISAPATIEVKIREFVAAGSAEIERYQFGYSIIRVGTPSP